MKTDKVLRLMIGVSCLASICELFSHHYHWDSLLLVFTGLQLLVGALMFYALYREKNLGDKSEVVSKKAAIAIFSGVGLMLALIILNVVRH